jgi:hypothetical protein
MNDAFATKRNEERKKKKEDPNLTFPMHEFSGL